MNLCLCITKLGSKRSKELSKMVFMSQNYKSWEQTEYEVKDES